MLELPSAPIVGEATVPGIVVDEPTGRAIAGASVRIGEARTTTDAGGRFVLRAPQGHAVLEVQAASHSSLVRAIGITDRNPPIEARLVPRQPATRVGAAGGTIDDASGAALEVPPGAYPSDTTLQVAFVDQAAALTGDALFVDADGRTARLLSVVDVRAEGQPSTPVTLRMIVPADVDAARLALYELDEATGEWVRPRAPLSTAGGIARYAVEHFSAYGQAERDSTAVAVITNCVRRTFPRRTSPLVFSGPCVPGMPLRNGQEIQTNGSTVEIQTRDGSRVDLSGDAVRYRVRDDVPSADTSIEATCEMPICVERMRSTTPRRPAPRRPYRLMIRSRAAVMGVRGTVLAWDARGCPAADGERASGEVGVHAGQVDVRVGSAARAMDAGARARFCVGCATPSEPACCYRFSWGSGGSSGGGTTVSGGDTSVCDDGTRYQCEEYGCQATPEGPTAIEPVACAGSHECPVVVPQCLAFSASSEGYCLPAEAPTGWERVTVEVAPVAGAAP
jgi:hypothetical protein